MKVYLVCEGEYSDYGVVAAFSKEDLAKAYIASHQDEYSIYALEVYDLDAYQFSEEGIAKGINTIKCGYDFCLGDNGVPRYKVNYYIIDDSDYDTNKMKGYFDLYDCFCILVPAKMDSPEEYKRCLKAARDAMAKAKAEKEGL